MQNPILRRACVCQFSILRENGNMRIGMLLRREACVEILFREENETSIKTYMLLRHVRVSSKCDFET